MGTEARQQRKEQSSGDGTTSRIRTNAAAPAQKRCPQDPPNRPQFAASFLSGPSFSRTEKQWLGGAAVTVPSLSSAHDSRPCLTLYSGEWILLSGESTAFKSNQDIDCSSWAITCSERTDLAQYPVWSGLMHWQVSFGLNKQCVKALNVDFPVACISSTSG
jgi:hypothetical protein